MKSWPLAPVCWAMATAAGTVVAAVMAGALLPGGVHFVAVGDGAVGQGRVGHGSPQGQPDDAAIAGAAQTGGQVCHRPAGGQGRAGNHAAQLVVEQGDGFLPDFLGYVLVSGLAGPTGRAGRWGR